MRINKKIFSFLLVLILGSQSGYSKGFNDNDSFYLYGGLDLGISQLDSDIPQEASSKNGLVWGGKLLGNYNYKHLSFNMGFGYFDNTFESESINNRKVRLTTSTILLEINPMYRFSKRHSFGLVWNQFLSEDLLVGASGIITGNNVQTKASKMIGLNYYYNIPWKKFRVRVGAQLMKPLSIGERSGLIALFNAQIGFPIYRKTNAPQRHKKRRVTKVKRVAQKPVMQAPVAQSTPAIKQEIPQKINVVVKKKFLNFKSNSSELDQTSLNFLSRLAEFLKEKSPDWTRLSINGHTDSQGPAKYNLALSVKRSQYVHSKLIEYGIAPDKVRFKGHGESKLINLNNSAEAHRENRRVELNFDGKTNAASIQEFFVQYNRSN